MKIKRSPFIIIVFIGLSINLYAQGVGINSTGAEAHESAILDVSSTTQGFLPPRMTESQRDAISSPATGLLIYQTDGTSGLYYYNGSSWESFVSGKHYIGESYGGGVVFWVDVTGQHGLIAATSDQSTGIQWYNDISHVTNATGNGVGAGEMNTTIIIAMQTNDNTSGSFAAKLCADLVITSGGINYGDWYLPSKYELDLMYSQRTTIGGFSGSYYWSSTEHLYDTAWLKYFDWGTWVSSNKNGAYYVRAVRQF